MTYTFSKEHGWIGYCDKCEKPFMPFFVYTGKFNDSGNIIVDEVVGQFIFGNCELCDYSCSFDWKKKYAAEKCFVKFEGVWTNKQYLKRLIRLTEERMHSDIEEGVLEKMFGGLRI